LLEIVGAMYLASLGFQSRYGFNPQHRQQ